MKCQYCGADVSLEDRICPHCGRAVDQAQRHQKEMEHYESEFARTREEALRKSGGTSGITTAIGIRLVVLAGLIILLIVMVVSLDPYSAGERKAKREALASRTAFTARIEEMLANRDYSELYTFNRRYSFEYIDEYKDYRYIFYAVDYMHRISRGLMELAYYREGPDSPYYTESLAKSVNEFFSTTEPDRYERYAADVDKTAEVYAQMEEELQILLRRYLGLTAEETASLRTLSASRRTVIIESAIDKILNGTDAAGTTAEPAAEEVPAAGAAAGSGAEEPGGGSTAGTGTAAEEEK